MDRIWVKSYPPGVSDTIELPEEPVTALLDEAVRQFPNNIATDFEGQTLTYAQLGKAVDKFASVLRDLGVGKGTRVGTLASVCTGSFLLGKAGLLDRRRATTHWRSLDRLAESFPSITVVRDLHVVEEENVLTSAGISAGIDMALRLVARHCGESVARATARHMEYVYPETNARRI